MIYNENLVNQCEKIDKYAHWIIYCCMVQIFKCLLTINHDRHAIAIYFCFVAEFYYFITRTSVDVNSSRYVSNVVFIVYPHRPVLCSCKLKYYYNDVYATGHNRGRSTPPLCR